MKGTPDLKDFVRNRLEDQGWVRDSDGCWRPSETAPKCFRDRLIREEPTLVLEWFVEDTSPGANDGLLEEGDP